jgi:hypothetical protein
MSQTETPVAAGKAARNERRKVTATYVNSVAIALFVAGIAMPLLSAINTTDAELRQALSSLLTWDGLERAVLRLIVTAVALGLSFWLHSFARDIANQLED